MSREVSDAVDYKGFSADRSKTGGWVPAALILGLAPLTLHLLFSSIHISLPLKCIFKNPEAINADLESNPRNIWWDLLHDIRSSSPHVLSKRRCSVGSSERRRFPFLNGGMGLR